MEGIALWQGVTLCGIVSWIFLSSYMNLTQKIRFLVQPWVAHRVVTGTPLTLQIQKHHHWFLDAFFSGLSSVVSVPFYTGFLPLLFWSGHGKLARQMTLLMSLCDYIGNSIKDVVSAPRPSCPPVRRITATKEEEGNAMEYGLPSSHTLNTICLSGYLLHYVLSYNQNEDALMEIAGFAILCVFVGLIALGRIYLGMHSPIDIVGGFALGVIILTVWLKVDNYVDDFIVAGQNVTYFWTALSFLLLFAYPTPEYPTPSFEFHAAFNGVTLGIVSGVQQTYHQFHHDSVAKVFTPQLRVTAFLGRILVGIPTILLVKFCSKALAKWTLPVVSNTLGIPIRSSGYIPLLNGGGVADTNKKSDNNDIITKQSSSSGGYLQCWFDVDTGIRFFQYAGLAWSVVDLVPTIFARLNL